MCFAWREGKCFCWQNLTALRRWCGWEMLFPQNDFQTDPRGQQSTRGLVVRFPQLSVRHVWGVNQIYDCTSRPPAWKYLHFPPSPWGNDACASRYEESCRCRLQFRSHHSVLKMNTRAHAVSMHLLQTRTVRWHARGVYMFVQSQNLTNICPGHISLQHQKETKINQERKSSSRQTLNSDLRFKTWLVWRF